MDSTAGCLSENELLEFLGGELQPERLVEIERHLDSCDSCRTVLRHATTAHAATLAPSSSAARPELAVRGARVGRYVVDELVGRGGMGVVYAAHDPELDRKVALKLLRADLRIGSDSEGEKLRGRLLREAQAMARLSHPNVVAVFDVGMAGHQLFVAMELVEGGTLASWLREPRPLDEILRRLVAAGRGLAAAHAAGFVHRDFKPANVLLGSDGRVCVSDFGLARLVDEAEPPSSPAPAPSQRSFESTLTDTGSLVGTPAYMAPEQLRCEDTDARTDQFSYCVTLYEAVYGERPFAGGTLAELKASILEGRLREPPRGRVVPSWLRRVLLRGLAAERSARYPSLTELLDELVRDRGAQRRRVLIALGALALLLLGVGLFGVARRQRLACDGAARLAGVWDPETRAALHAAFSRTGKPYAEGAWRSVERSLDAFTGAWARMYSDACEATHVRREQSAELLDLRMECLGGRLAEVGALTSLFSDGAAQPPVDVERAVAAVQGLADLSACANVRALRQRRPPPSDPAGRAAYDGLQKQLAGLTALVRAGRFAEGSPKLAGVVAEAERLAHPLLLSDAYRAQGMFLRAQKDLAGAQRADQRAAAAAERGADDGRAALAWDALAQAALEVDRHDDAERWLEHAAAAGERAGPDPSREANHLRGVAIAILSGGRYAEAMEPVRKAVALYHRAGDVVGEADLLYLLGMALGGAGQLDEGDRTCSESLRLVEESLGPGNPASAEALDCLSTLAFASGHASESVAVLKIITVREASFGADSPRVAETYAELAMVLLELGKSDEALAAVDKADGILARAPGGPERFYESALARGMTLSALGRASEALPLLEGCLQRLSSDRDDQATFAVTSFALARALWQSGRDRARALRVANEAATAASRAGAAPYFRALRDQIAVWRRDHVAH